jgi:outer membrane protein TolC
MKLLRFAALLFVFFSCVPARAQMPRMPDEPQAPPQASRPVPPGTSAASLAGPNAQNPFFGGVPSGERTAEALPLSLRGSLDRALKHNLGLLLSEQGTREARGARLKALSDLLPNATAHVTETVQQVNLAQFGFSGLPGVPPIVGPFSVFDTRAYLSQPLLDLPAIHNARAESANLDAARYSYQDARDLVVLVTAALYLQAVTGASRVEAQRAQLRTAEALFQRAEDLKKAGVVPGIDVLRAQVEMQAQRQRLIYYENEFAKQKLALGRAIGLPIAQEIILTDRVPYAPPPSMTLEQASQQALSSRADYQSALAQVRAAEAERLASKAKSLPALRFDGNYGDIGRSPGSSHGSFVAAFDLKIPIFQGGKIRGEVLQADARLQQRKDELADLRGRIELEVRTAFLDLRASGDQVQVARGALDLANQQLEQARDRFSAGVVNSIEVVQAQEAVATANENYISSLYAFNLAKAALARALGIAEKSIDQFLGGTQP